MLIAVITAFLFNKDIECSQCIPYEERRGFIIDDIFGLTVYVITCSLIVLLPVFFYLIQGNLYEYINVCCVPGTQVLCDCFEWPFVYIEAEDALKKQPGTVLSVRNLTDRLNRQTPGGVAIRTTSRDIGFVLRSGKLDAFEELLEFGANVRTYSTPDSLHYTLLHLVCLIYKLPDRPDLKRLDAIVDRLISSKCPLLANDAQIGMPNAFMFACEIGVPSVAKKCVASFPVSLKQVDRNGRTPAFLAALSRSRLLFEFLKEKGAKTEGITDKHNMTIESIIEQNASVGWEDGHGHRDGTRRSKILLLGTGFVTEQRSSSS